MPAPEPDAPFIAVGDLHGCDHLFDALVERVDIPRLVFVGDYVDRGEHTGRLLRKLHAISTHYPDHVTCLMGNHEQVLLKFLDDPRRYGADWLRMGGLQTLASYGIPGVTEQAGPNTLEAARDAMRSAMGPNVETWLRSLPSSWRSGNLVVVHAATDPDLPLGAQNPTHLMWGRGAPCDRPRSDGIWVIHGHYIVPQAQIASGHIAIDTGAYATGRLTMARVTPGQVTFEEVSRSPASSG